MTEPVAAPRWHLPVVAAVALVARLAVAVWAAPRFPPTADGAFYHTIAQRIAQGFGYTWLWPDGVVTFAAHYPVGYPAALGLLYFVFGPSPAVAMLLHAVLGTAASTATYALARRMTSERRALVVGLVAALHVGFVAYVPAMMTEGVTAGLWVIAAWCVARAREESRRRIAWIVAMGVVLGAATLMRPQSLALLPVFAVLTVPAGAGVRAYLRSVAVAAVVAMVVCAPWLVRNRVRMEHASLSFNGGWNLLIGTSATANGTWAPLEVPQACREVFDEAKKDICFGQAAAEQIGRDPVGWLALAPKKLASTFDYCGAAGWYLHASNPEAFSHAWKVRLGAVETVYERAVLLAALLGLGLAQGPHRRVRLVLLAVSAPTVLIEHVYFGYLGFAAIAAAWGRGLVRAPVAVGAALGVVVVTAATHVVFFGAGRYGMLVFPFVLAAAGGLTRQAQARPDRQLLTAGASPGDTAGRQGEPSDAPH